ncbi:zinc-dependent alcohol dehydrogenase family protein [Paucimonas lemoignei]|nr:zinc-dependent alcohol dehydrogenase family protein [Paucimonas lemoignei]
MVAMQLEQVGQPLTCVKLVLPVPREHEILIQVRACGVCRTDLHIADGDLVPHHLPLTLGHEVVGTVVERGTSAQEFAINDRVGVPWLAGSCGHCRFCLAEHENLCNDIRFTGFDHDGGYAEYLVADARYCFHVPERYDDMHVAPLLCAGLIGYRAYAMAGDAERIGFYGFGAAAHIISQVARHRGQQVFAFTRPGDSRSQDFARSLGVTWAGNADARPPAELDAAIIFAPVGALVPQALTVTRKGGTVICAGIHMSDLPAFPYAILWGERSVRSVANLTREDGRAFFQIADHIPLKTMPIPFPLTRANDALNALRDGAFDGAAVLIP